MIKHIHQSIILIFYLYSWITLDTPPSRDTHADTSGKENTQVLYRRPKCPSMFDVYLLILSFFSFFVFHVASRGFAINFGFPAVGVMFKLFQLNH